MKPESRSVIATNPRGPNCAASCSFFSWKICPRHGLVSDGEDQQDLRKAAKGESGQDCHPRFRPNQAFTPPRHGEECRGVSRHSYLVACYASEAQSESELKPSRIELRGGLAECSVSKIPIQACRPEEWAVRLGRLKILKKSNRNCRFNRS